MADELEPQARSRPRRPRWGLRALGFLVVALVGVLARGGDYALLAAVGLVVGLSGAAYCSYRGLKDFTWLPR